MSSAGQLGRLLGYVRPYWVRVAAAATASSGAAAASAAYAFLVGPLLKSVLTGGDVVAGPLVLHGSDLLIRFPLLVVTLATIKAVGQLIQGGLMQSVGQRVVTDLRRELYSHWLALRPRFFETRHSGELLSRFTADVAQVDYAVNQGLASYVKDVLQVIAQLVACWIIDRRLFLLAFIVLPGAVIPVSRFARQLKRVARRTQASLGQLTELTAEQLHNLPAVQAFDGRPRGLARFDAEQGRYLDAMDRSLFIRGAFTPSVEILGILGVALAIGFGAKAVGSEPALAAKLLSFLAAALLMYQPLKALSGTFALALQGVGAASRLFEILDEPLPVEKGEAVGPLRNAIEIEALDVAYDVDRPVLRGLNLTLTAGQRVALVGASGAGKSTVVATLLRFIEPRSGMIRWDGLPLDQTRPSSTRAQMAWVPQEPVLFSGTVRSNVLMGRPDATEPELWSALDQAHATGFVRAFPRGLDEPVGERGSRLSGGQRQRIAIARAFIRAPTLLLLDEPTSALDAAAESEVQIGLDALMKGRTTLVIAHRLSTVRAADQICVLDEGRIVEQGTHSELVARAGRYAALLARGELAVA